MQFDIFMEKKSRKLGEYIIFQQLFLQDIFLK